MYSWSGYGSKFDVEEKLPVTSAAQNGTLT